MLIDDFEGVRILVVGDVMLDRFVTGSVERVSPEAPALVLHIDEEHCMLGGAGNVAANIASLGGVASLVGAIGQDAAAAEFESLLRDFDGALVDGLVRAAEVQTTSKTRFIAGDRHLLRADSESRGLSDAVEAKIIASMRAAAAGCGAIVISDYAKGVVTRAVVEAAVELGTEFDVPVIADPKRRDFGLYAGAQVLTPNRKELEFTTGLDCASLDGCAAAAARVSEVTGAAVLLTRSEDGMALFKNGETLWHDVAHAKVVRDVSGAGDTVLAVTAVALAAGADLAAAAHAANVAAAIAVGKPGTSSVTTKELHFSMLHAPDSDALLGKLMTHAAAVSVRELWASQGLSVGFTNGCFDLLHPGHVQLLASARQACDRLIVGLNTDASVSRLKGPERPVQTEVARAEVIGALRSVDMVVLFGEDTPIELIRDLRPDLLIKGADYTVETVVGAELVQGWGGRVVLIDLVPGQSSSRLIANSRGDR
ncbi:MAG: D-glycero-beta-D-manno-heptose 1-phosphate adenylyltransferase [Patulibacter sp.]